MSCNNLVQYLRSWFGGGRDGTNERVMESLLREIKERIDQDSHDCLEMIDGKHSSVFFVGAGASIDSGLPNFRQFSEHMLVSILSLSQGVSMTDISMFVSELRPEVLLQTLHEVCGNKIFEFYDWFDGAMPSTNHFILARVLREGGFVLTTNIDVLIEEAYVQKYGGKDFNLLVTKEDFENYAIGSTENSSKGTLMKFHGTVDLTKPGLEKYDTVRFLLDQVGKGMSTGMHQVLKEICENHNMVYLGYSGCDNFSVQPILCNTISNKTILWMWYEWRKEMIVEHSREIYEKEMNTIGNLVGKGKSFNDINRGMEILSTCEVLTQRKNSLRLRGKVSDIMNATARSDDFVVVDKLDSKGPVPEWTTVISRIDRVRCAAKLYSRSNCTDEGITFLEEANRLAAETNDTFLKAQLLKDLGNEYAKASTSDNYKKALMCYDKALPLFKASGHSIQAMETKLDRVNVLRRTRHFDDAEKLLEEVNVSEENESSESMLKIKVRKGLMKALILGMGHRDKESRSAAILILQGASKTADEGGFVELQSAILNASGLIKYQMAGDSVEILKSGATDLDAAFRLNIYIGAPRSCFQQMRNLGLIHAKLSRLLNDPELLEQAIEDFRRGEKFLFRLSKSRIMGELLEIRFRLGESLVAADHFVEAKPILSDVRDERVKLDDWHNEARTLELLIKCALHDPKEMIERALQINAIYEDALTNEAKQTRFVSAPITAANGRQILKTASDLVRKEDFRLSQDLQELINKLFGDVPCNVY